MDKINTIISLNETKKSIDELIEKVKGLSEEQETDYRKILIIVLSVIGSLVVIGAIAFAIYKYMSSDGLDDYDDLYDDEEDEELYTDDDLIDDIDD
ncbi:MAG: hypothetical protein K6E30_04080 [Lachnospiraceae bacterium]|nr:hypothetical protein [Lachnospiraceae bacterium]